MWHACSWSWLLAIHLSDTSQQSNYGNYAANHVSKIANLILQVQQLCMSKQANALKQYALLYLEEVQPLHRAVYFASCRSILDPFSGNGVVATGLQQISKRVITNDIINQHWVS
eukprot:jgi/Chrzof1/2792/UNPLg00706.t1